MRVLLIGDYPPPYGGVSIHVASLAEKLKTREIEVKVLDIGPNRRVDRDNCVLCKGYFDFIKKVILFLRNGYLIHLHTNGHNAKSWVLVFISSLLAKTIGSPLITTFHSGILPSYLRNASLLQKWTARLSCAMCGNIICVSEEVRKAIQCFLKHDHKFHVIPAFIGATDMDQSFSETTARFLEKHTPVISTVAHFSPEYGLRVLLEAVAKVKEKFEKLGLIVIGEGEEKEINRRIEDLGIKQNVLIRNGLEHSKCIYSIKHTDLFIRPSYIDGDSIAVREAIYLGIPVLASDAVKRPPQACLFKTGDVENLKDKIELMLGTQPGIPLAGRNNVDGDNLGKILKLYRVTGH